jgi:hypothetical protein
MEPLSGRGRILEIDIAKGLACLLMIAAHAMSRKVMPFGTFAAPLFFTCSGMNAILLIEKTKGNKCHDLFHLAFPLLLFFGGSTQIVIAHGGRWRVLPEFLQCIALSLLVIFALSKLFKVPRCCGLLFPVPFLVKDLQAGLLLDAFKGMRLQFIFRGGFALFPWLGFFLFGVFLLWLKRSRLPWLLAVLSSAFILSLAIAGVQLQKFRMSFSYMLLALAAVTLAFMLATWIARRGETPFFKGLAGFFALSGRNALMFLYLHYFMLRYFASVDLFPLFPLQLGFEIFYLYFVCWVLLQVYEKVKNDGALLLPALALFLALGALRWGGMLKSPGAAPVADLVIGILFAFVYVLLRRTFAARCARGEAAGT